MRILQRKLKRNTLQTTTAHYRHTLQTHTTDTHYSHELQTHTTDTHYSHALRTRTTDTHCRHALQTHSSSFLTQRTYSCSNFYAISSLVLELLTLSCRTTHTHTHTHIYMCVCVCVFVSYRTANLLMLNFIYYSTDIRTEYFKHAAHSPFFLFKMPFIS